MGLCGDGLHVPYELIFNPHGEPTVFLFHEWRGNQKICCSAVAGDGNVVDDGDT
jgi:hypothetical protein